jgi:hypothetical protein
MNGKIHYEHAETTLFFIQVDSECEASIIISTSMFLPITDSPSSRALLWTREGKCSGASMKQARTDKDLERLLGCEVLRAAVGHVTSCNL